MAGMVESEADSDFSKTTDDETIPPLFPQGTYRYLLHTAPWSASCDDWSFCSVSQICSKANQGSFGNSIFSKSSLIIDGFISCLHNDKLSVPKRVPCKCSGRFKGRLYALTGHSEQLSVKNPKIYCF